MSPKQVVPLKALWFSWNVSWLCTLFPIATSEAAKKPRYSNDILSWRVRWKANSLLLAGRRFEVVQINSCRGLKVEGSSHFIVVTHSIPLLKRTTKNRLSWSTQSPLAWYTAPLKLTVVFIVALDISLVKLQAWPVNQGWGTSHPPFPTHTQCLSSTHGARLY